MKLTIINEETGKWFNMCGEFDYMLSDSDVTYIHIKSKHFDLFEFEYEAIKNEDGLRSIGMKVNSENSCRDFDDLKEYFTIPKEFTVRLSVD